MFGQVGVMDISSCNASDAALLATSGLATTETNIHTTPTTSYTIETITALPNSPVVFTQGEFKFADAFRDYGSSSSLPPELNTARGLADLKIDWTPQELVEHVKKLEKKLE